MLPAPKVTAATSPGRVTTPSVAAAVPSRGSPRSGVDGHGGTMAAPINSEGPTAAGSSNTEARSGVCGLERGRTASGSATSVPDPPPSLLVAARGDLADWPPLASPGRRCGGAAMAGNPAAGRFPASRTPMSLNSPTRASPSARPTAALSVLDATAGVARAGAGPAPIKRAAETGCMAKSAQHQTTLVAVHCRTDITARWSSACVQRHGRRGDRWWGGAP
mmetsp:Transcript_39261/g.113479  ORF Transcript_39261/g.113479 Transcript_39261/m.113479 type:complete len:220 (+) Transcript_39261:1042-1701(+)